LKGGSIAKVVKSCIELKDKQFFAKDKEIMPMEIQDKFVVFTNPNERAFGKIDLRRTI
jgi:hypothetical protein